MIILSLVSVTAKSRRPERNRFNNPLNINMLAGVICNKKPGLKIIGDGRIRTGEAVVLKMRVP